ncbi:hypothetical protein TUM3794_02720 [Shewanella colwelliana]|uniref:Uncharacterized protein n=1 Tax=Shewanella colwelliana TaxID=23 RepID=A0ABQ4NUT5_SHECO|nr:hypothetical protein TUM3794_02720 [Shewanella colwelliana]
MLLGSRCAPTGINKRADFILIHDKATMKNPATNVNGYWELINRHNNNVKPVNFKFKLMFSLVKIYD